MPSSPRSDLAPAWRKGLRRVVDEILLGPLRDIFVSFEGFKLSQRILAVLGYAFILALLIVVLVLELSGSPNLLTYENVDGSLKQIPLMVVIVCSVGFAVAWAFLLTGATDCPPIVFGPIVAFFLLQLMMTMPQEDVSGSDVWICTAPLFYIALIVLYILTRRKKRYWLAYPLVEFGLWLAAMLFFIGLSWLSGQSWSAVAENFHGGFTFVALVSIVFWALSGLAVVDAAVKIARYVIGLLRRLFARDLFPLLTVLLVLAHPLVVFVAIGFGGSITDNSLNMGLLADGMLALVLVIVMLLLLVLRRWTVTAASFVLALSVVFSVFSVGLGLVFGGRDLSDPLGLALGELGVLPPQMLFVFLAGYSILSVGASFANGDSKGLPRSGRYLLVLGVTLLMICFTLFFVNIRDAHTGEPEGLQESVDNFFAIGLLVLGLPYLGWVIWKEREDLIGRESDFEGVEPVLGRLPSISRKWLVVGVVGLLMLACLGCLLLALWAPPPS
ncbi:MAG: hypothetical protein JXA37_05735 [Chloroflexia bacterium]|nr:hypothetical protein [Chloroflexia bacterium]